MSKIVLEVFIKREETELFELYKNHINIHNENLKNNKYPNAGFDLFIPNDVDFKKAFENILVDLKVRLQMWKYVVKPNYSLFEMETDFNMDDLNETLKYDITPCSYYMYPRSSICKTPLIISNSLGIIDSGYRNNIMVPLRYITSRFTDYSFYTLHKNSRITQICHPSLEPIYVKIYEDTNQLTLTSRNGGFGSTGIIGEMKPILKPLPP
jgi:deoxycytidine triphosphate deaminase